MEDRVSNIPVLYLSPLCAGNQKIILLSHALLLNKSSQLPLAQKLAGLGYFVVMIDTHGHGDREGSFEQTGFLDFSRLYQDAYQTAEDAAVILAELRTRFPHLDNTDITCIGVSNGANIAFISGYLLPRVTRVVSVIGSLDWRGANRQQTKASFRMFEQNPHGDAASSLENDIKRYHPRYHYPALTHLPKLLCLNGILDTTMGIAEAMRSFNEIFDIYRARRLDNWFCFKKYKKAGHNVTYEMIDDLITWLCAENAQ